MVFFIFHILKKKQKKVIINIDIEREDIKSDKKRIYGGLTRCMANAYNNSSNNSKFKSNILNNKT